jgi:ABC-type transport system involved in multi-copper enzyme maturation permease subunit
MSACWILIARSLLDSWLLLGGCATLLAVFMAFRIWVAAQINFDAVTALLAGGNFRFLEKMLPVPLEVIASPTGRVAFGFEEFPVVLLAGLWTISRGSESVAGRLQDGTLEMLLAQPIRRATLLASHSAVTLLGVTVLAAAAWAGTAWGIAIADFAAPPPWQRFLPAALNLGGLATFMVGAATFASVVLPSRSRAVGVVVGVLVVELTLLLLARATPAMAWLKAWTILSAYDPTALCVQMTAADGTGLWPRWDVPDFWIACGWLYGLGAALWAAALWSFAERDVPAPI